MPSKCTVYGNLSTLSGGILPQGMVIMELANTGVGNPITVIGTTVIPQLKYTIFSAADGTFSEAVWGNDNISPLNTIYNITFRNAAGDEVGPIQYSITGSSVNLNSAGAVNNMTPPVLAANVPILTLLNQQGPLSPVTGTGADANLYTFTIPANTVAQGQGIRISLFFVHGTGTASVIYKLKFGSTVMDTKTYANFDTTATDFYQWDIFNTPSVQNAQSWSRDSVINLAGSATNTPIVTTGTSAVNFALSQVLSFTFSVAATDAVTPKFWLVELINGPTVPTPPRLMVYGSQLVSGDFTLTGWGSGATIVPTTPSCDSVHSFLLTAGTGITSPPPNPTIQLTYHDGIWPNAPTVIAQIVGGTCPTSDLTITGTSSAYTIAYQGWPPDGSTLILNVHVVGQ